MPCSRREIALVSWVADRVRTFCVAATAVAVGFCSAAPATAQNLAPATAGDSSRADGGELMNRLRMFQQKRGGRTASSASSRQSGSQPHTSQYSSAAQSRSSGGYTQVAEQSGRDRFEQFPGDAETFSTQAPPQGAPSDLPRIGHTPISSARLQPQTPGEIPELIPEQPPERYLLPPTHRPARQPGGWDGFRQKLAGPPPLILHQVYGATTWVFGSGDEVGLFDVFVQGTFVTPWITGFTITPSFQSHFVSGPSRTDLPPTLFGTRVEFRWQKPFSERFALDLSLAPGVFSDFEGGNSDSFRILARVLGLYQWSQTTQVVAGIVYLDREDVKLLPALGVIYLPSDDLRLEFVFPRPKFSMRVYQGERYSRWCYVMGEFGGGSWAIQRRSGADDVVTYSDWRLLFGFEQRYANDRSLFLETGVVFNRQIEYARGPGDFDPDATGMIRIGLTY